MCTDATRGRYGMYFDCHCSPFNTSMSSAYKLEYLAAFFRTVHLSLDLY